MASCGRSPGSGRCRRRPWAFGRAGERSGAIAGGQATSEEGFLLARLLREGLASPHVDSRAAGPLALSTMRALNDPRLQATTSDLEFADAVLVLDANPIADAPILDLRLRKGARRRGVKIVQAGAQDLRARHEQLAAELKEIGAEIVVLWHERLAAGPDSEATLQALLALASELSLADTAGAGLLEIPALANGRGLREAGVLPNAGAGLAPLNHAGPDGRDAHAIAQGLFDGELSAVVLLQCDPCEELPDAALWGRALERASTVIAYASSLGEGLLEHVDVVLPAQSYAEKEGTVVHPDGRIQRLRPAVGQPGQTRAQWLVLASLAQQIGLDLEVRTARAASEQLFDAVSFYAGLTLEEIGGKGVRWQERQAAGAYPVEQPA